MSKRGPRQSLMLIWSMITVNLLTVIMASIAVLMSLCGVSGHTVHRTIIRRWARWAIHLSFVRVRRTGLERINPPEGPFVVVMNHQSLLDVPVVVANLPLQLRFIGKMELAKIPFFGAAAKRCGHIFIDRKDHDRSIAALRELSSRISASRISIVIAAEGTRSEDGKLLPFKKGAFVTAINLGLPVLPVVIRGSRVAVPKGELGSVGGIVDLIIEDPIPTAGMTYEDRGELMDLVRERMEMHLK